MTTAALTEIRLTLQLSAPQRELIEQGAARSGQSLDDFAVATLVERARQVLQADTTSVLPEGRGGGEPNGAVACAEPKRRRRFESGDLLENSERVILDHLAMIGWGMTPPFAQEQIRQTLEALALRSTSDWPRGVVELWRPDEQLYALHTMVGPDHLLVLFSREEDCIRLRHMVLKETIDRYFTPKTGG
jgi:hypothetical protein